MVLAMDGVRPRRSRRSTRSSTRCSDDGDGAERRSTLVRFNGLGLIDQLMHTVASPPMAYLLFVIGLALLIFEFFTAGVGIAGVRRRGVPDPRLLRPGRAARRDRCAVALLLLSMLAFAVDVQVGIPRLWTGVGIVLFIIASWFLYEPCPATTCASAGSR